ncbi:MAG: response regulator transcription factor [Bacteroidota bacterium]|nr:response regulator transcription factor [Bacteroidota bacterium]
MPKRILLVEDEASLHELLKLNLEIDGNKVIGVKDGESAIKKFKEEQFDLIILDVMIPGINGLNVCESIRLKDRNVPILFLSAKSRPEDRVEGLKKGADDYLTKPFNLEELQLRINNLLTRNYKGSNVSAAYPTGQNTEYSFGLNYVNFETHEAKGVNGVFLLTKKEVMLLRLLIEHKNEIVSREKILQTVWGYSVYPATRTIDNFILSFRKYFELDPKHPKFIISIRGVGYMFEER